MNFSRPLTEECFALLDDASATEPRSRLYTGLVGTLSCGAPSALPALWRDMQQALREGKHAVGLFTYELGADLHGIAAHPAECCRNASQVLLFEHCARLSAAEVDRWLDARAAGPAGVACVQHGIEEEAFRQVVGRIRAYIEAGDTYQVNFTWPLCLDAYGSPLALYARLRQRQPVPFGALIALPDGTSVLSLSPELFVRHENGALTARPMKGTASASGDALEDVARARRLANDPKNRAENLMIVDLLRNDLGRIAAAGSVAVPSLFEVSRYSSVLQMTSTVVARLREEVGLAQAFEALYPCGSITGAPKHRTMQIIRELEQGTRGFYTGAIGWFDAPRPSGGLGDFCLSVPIRTLLLQGPGEDGVRKGELRVGAGIVHDSVAAHEYEECLLKARFLTGLSQQFELFETMHATRDAGCRHADLHMRRLSASAAYFGFRFDEGQARMLLGNACAALAPGAHRLRLALNHSGQFAVQSAQLSPLQAPVKLLLAPEPVDRRDLFLRHKTTLRERYDAAWRAAEAQGAFDMLFFNKDGELTEGARSNVFVRLQGRWHTPPLDAGLLPGVMRTVLLSDPAWNATERRLTVDDLRAAEGIVVCNALRGAVPAILA